ncbi:heat shock 70 kDa protein 12A-like [Stylophora pistillata]|uniref:heat shock 70 kDa protein 12A-like n=1 Tax=Stylophora pistillata TaxID=50429 RepID=UPI000C03D487|nr:heat shock 70 kDa protein 12A-like [Stylophora pistillata]
MASQTPFERDVIIAIDFGTTYSGFGYVFLNASQDHIYVFQKWGRGQGMGYGKTPTALLLTEKGEFHKFGHAAVETYGKQAMSKKDCKKLLYFDKFKLLLHSKKDLNERTEVKARNGKKWPALDVFAKCLEYLKKTATDVVNERHLRSEKDNPHAEVMYKPEQIQWVITIPAIWRISAKEFMRKAAYKAGIASPEDPDQLILALEPEAASYYCRKLPFDMFKGQKGKELVKDTLDKEKVPYMVVDNGGGTLDITVHEVNADNGHILEKHCPSGGTFGGIHVDQEFEQLMIKAFGDDFIRRFKELFPSDWQVIMNRFEEQKRAEEEVDNDEISIALPLNFIKSCYHEIGEDDAINKRVQRFCPKNVSVSSDYLNITMGMLGSLHRPIVTKIAEQMKSLLAKQSLQDVKTIFLVGGFSEAQFLRKEISRQFPDKRILIPPDPQLAIIRGAVEFAQEPSLLRARVMGKTYGLNIWNDFDPEKHPLEKQEIIRQKVYCRDIFKTLAKKGERIDIDEKRTYNFCPLNPDSTEFSFEFYSTDEDDADFISDPGVVSENVEILISSPNTAKGCDRELRLEVRFGGTETKVQVLDVESGNVKTACLQLVSSSVFHSRFY